MHKFLRFYNKNRIKIWTIILAIISVLAMIQVLNAIIRENNQKQNNNNSINQEKTSKVSSSYNSESKSIISEDSVTGTQKTEFGQLIDKFFTYCINHQPEEAYKLLSDDSKSMLYETETIFEGLYYNTKFEGNKSYSFQSWIKDLDTYLYQVKIFENMLATGKSNDTYIEDFVSIVRENNEYKINVNSYVEKKDINKSAENSNLSIKINYVNTYLDYEIYTLTIKNKTYNKDLILDTRNNTDTTYLMDNNNNKFESFLYENEESDLKIGALESKTIQIKFNDEYRENKIVKSMNFTDILVNNEKSEDLQIEM